MVSNGSSEAFLKLVVLAGDSFFSGKNDDPDEEIYTCKDKENADIDLIGDEAATVVSEEICNDRISDISKVLALCQALSSFGSTNIEGVKCVAIRGNHCYKVFVPVMVHGLQSSSRFEKTSDSDNIGDNTSSESLPNNLSPTSDSHNTDDSNFTESLVNILWSKVCSTLTLILSPVHVTLATGETDFLKIPRETEVIELITASAKCVPKEHCDDLCKVLWLGASDSIKVAKTHALTSSVDYKTTTAAVPIKSTEASESFSDTSRKTCDRTLKLFMSCFSSVCIIKPDFPDLKSIAEQVLKGAYNAVGGGEDDDDTETTYFEWNVEVEAALIVCNSIKQNSGTETLVIALFPLLCNLISTDHSKLRKAVAAALTVADIARILLEAQQRFQSAEKRADDAEKQAADLTTAIGDLQRKNEALQLQVASSSSSSSFFG